MKTLEEIKKEFTENFKVDGGLPWGYEDWDNYSTALWSFIESTISQTKQELIEEVKKMINDPTKHTWVDIEGTNLIKEITEDLEKLSNK